MGQAFFAGGVDEIGQYTRVIDVWNTNTKTWSTSSMGKARSSVSVVSVQDKYIVFAGGESAKNGTATAYVDIWDCAKESWFDQRNILGSPRSQILGVSNGPAIVLIGGFDSNSNPVDTVDIWNSINNTWTTMSFPEAAGGLIAAALPNNGVLVQGAPSGTDYLLSCKLGPIPPSPAPTTFVGTSFTLPPPNKATTPFEVAAPFLDGVLRVLTGENVQYKPSSRHLQLIQKKASHSNNRKHFPIV